MQYFKARCHVDFTNNHEEEGLTFVKNLIRFTNYAKADTNGYLQRLMVVPFRRETCVLEKQGGHAMPVNVRESAAACADFKKMPVLTDSCDLDSV